MLFHRPKRWICRELEEYLLSLHPTYFISVKRCVDGATANFPFRDDDGKLLIDPYDRYAVSIDVDYMKTGFPVETIYVKGGCESRRFPDIKEKLEKYVSMFPQTSWTTSLKQLSEMREELRMSLCNSMGINFIRDEGCGSPSIRIHFSALSPEAKRRVSDLICNLDEDAVDVYMSFLLNGINAERIYATLDQLALYDAQKEAAANDDEGELSPPLNFPLVMRPLAA